MQWNGIKNGALLKLLEQNGFDCLIIADKNLPYQQNVSNLPCVIIVLDVFRNTLKHISQLMPKILSCLEAPADKTLLLFQKMVSPINILPGLPLSLWDGEGG